jgi:hypothetical protein
MRSLSHEHQPRGAGGVLEDQFISDNRVLSGARERRLEDVAVYSDYVGSWSRPTVEIYWRTSSS